MTRTAPRPPGPRGLPFLGSALDYRRDPTNFLEQIARTHGDVVYSHFGRIHLYLVNHPDHLEHVLVTRRDRYGKDQFLRSLAPVLGQGLLLAEGQLWKTQRRRMAPAFAHRHVGQYAPAIAACTRDHVARWRPGEVIDVGAEVMRLTLDIALRALFGTDAGDDPARVGRAVTVMSEHFAHRLGNPLAPPRWLPTPGNRALERAIVELDAVVARILAARRSSPPAAEPRDLLDMLLAARDDDGSAMDDRQLRDEVLTLLLAGHETTAQALTYGLYLLSRHPEIDAALAAERAALGAPPTLADLPCLPLHEQVALETLRLYPPAATIGREALQDDEIAGWQIPRGAIVVMSQWVMHRDPRFYPDPTRFHPQRWTAEFKRQLPRLAYFPFGAGSRVCIGEAFAMLEARLALAVLLADRRLVPVDDAPLQVYPSVTLRPKRPVRLRVQPREVHHG
jgi:cytochrome P450